MSARRPPRRRDDDRGDDDTAPPPRIDDLRLAVDLRAAAASPALDDDDDLASLSTRESEFARLRADNVLLSHVVTNFVEEQRDPAQSRSAFTPRGPPRGLGRPPPRGL